MNLAIVIPAYKKQFLAAALDSLSRQTRQDFVVYIGDDHSPQELKPVIDSFSDRLAIRYHRFPENIGSENLVRQWSRCVNLTQGEKWIWLFSDDDLASPRCVEAFFNAASAHDSDVFRFNTRVIDEQGREKSPSLPSPDFETSEQMAYHLLYWRRGNSMPDHIFSRDVYDRSGGFVYTPYAQGADWATSILFSKQKGMRVIQDGMISWRQSGQNVSSSAAAKKKAVIGGHYRFLEWTLDHFKYLEAEGERNGISYQHIRDAALHNLKIITIHHYKGLAPSQYSEYVRFLRRTFGFSWRRSVRELAPVVVKTSLRGKRN